MSVVWLVRHGEAEKAPGQSPEDLFSAARDPPLSARGIAEAERTRDALAHEKIEAVYASPAARAQGTARILAAPHGLAVNIDARLVELNVAGNDHETTLANILELPSRFKQTPTTFGDERAAFAAAITEIVAKHSRAIVVAHGLSNRAYLCKVRGIPLDEMLTIPMDHAHAVRIDLTQG